MTNYASGRRKEWQARDLLEGAGYTVLRTAGSKGLVDLIALSGHVLLVQCKSSTASLGPAAWNTLFDTAQEANCVPILAVGASRKPIRFLKITGRKDKTRNRNPPCEVFPLLGTEP